MAFMDALTLLANNQAVTASAAGTATFDVCGVGSGTVTSMITGVSGSTGSAVPIGFDIGAGDGFAIPELYWNVVTAFSASTAATMTIGIQAAPDNGSGSSGTYQTIVQTGAISVASLTAGTNGQFQIPPVGANWTGEALPRFYQVYFTAGVGNFTGGNITAELVLNPSQATKLGKYPGNYVA